MHINSSYVCHCRAWLIVLLYEEECASVDNRRQPEKYVTTARVEPSLRPVSLPSRVGIIPASTFPSRDKLRNVNLVADNISRRARSCKATPRRRRARSAASLRTNCANDALVFYDVVPATRDPMQTQDVQPRRGTEENGGFTGHGR